VDNLSLNIGLLFKLHEIGKLKFTKFDFGWRPDPLDELTALPRPLAGFKGPTSKGSDGKKDGREGQGEGRGRSRREGREERGK